MDASISFIDNMNYIPTTSNTLEITINSKRQRLSTSSPKFRSINGLLSRSHEALLDSATSQIALAVKSKSTVTISFQLKFTQGQLFLNKTRRAIPEHSLRKSRARFSASLSFSAIVINESFAFWFREGTISIGNKTILRTNSLGDEGEAKKAEDKSDFSGHFCEEGWCGICYLGVILIIILEKLMRYL